ncbi:MAG: SprT-like domain-containing protein [Bacteroidota bacterium]
MRKPNTQYKKKFRDGLSRHIPDEAVDMVMDLLVDTHISISVKPPRKTKTGDFRPGNLYEPHRISVNSNLPEPIFLFILLHEIAHLKVWENYGRTQPHGRYWQKQFRHYTEQAAELNAFPEKLKNPIREHVRKGYASSWSDPELSRIFSEYMNGKQNIIDDLPDGEDFKIQNGLKFKKLHKMRTRIKCYCHSDGRYYLFQQNAVIEPCREKQSATL